jgi:hypothetical protein
LEELLMPEPVKVVVIDEKGRVLTRGTWNGKRVDSMFVQVNGEWYNLAHVWPAEAEDEIVASLLQNAAALKAAQDKHLDTLLQLRNRFFWLKKGL